MQSRNAISLFRKRYLFHRACTNNVINARSTSTSDHDQFYGSRPGGFVQEQPVLKNQYFDDPVLRNYLQKALPSEVFTAVDDDLTNFGDRVATDILHHHEEVGKYEPTLHQYDGWGKRIDHIQYHPSWCQLHDVAASEQLVSIPYQNKYGSWSRLYQCAKLYLFNPSSGLYSCPLAMTDGAASILQFQTSAEPFRAAFKRLTTNDPSLFWTSGQWMTEKKGGSDVGNGTETYAVPQSDGTYRLYGYKWFTSAIDADIALTLARIVDESGKVTKGSKGLTMFYLETRNDDGSLNGLKIEKLKKKLGTRQMPTAELILEGTKAFQVSDVGRGVASISPMLTITRIHNGISAVATMRRVLNLSKDFARKRTAFGRLLKNTPLHLQTLARMEVEAQAGFYLTMKVCGLLGRLENKESSDYEKLLLRILTPLLKLYTAKQAVQVASEGLESFGGHGYLEDTGLPVYLRDAQVLSIWEGTTNVLSLDVLRSISTSNGEVLKVFLQDCQSMISSVSNQPELQKCHEIVHTSLEQMQSFIGTSVNNNKTNHLELAARDFAYSLSRLYIASLLYQNAINNPFDTEAAQLACRWTCLQDLIPVVRMSLEGCYSDDAITHDALFVFPNRQD